MDMAALSKIPKEERMSIPVIVIDKNGVYCSVKQLTTEEELTALIADYENGKNVYVKWLGKVYSPQGIRDYNHKVNYLGEIETEQGLSPIELGNMVVKSWLMK